MLYEVITQLLDEPGIPSPQEGLYEFPLVPEVTMCRGSRQAGDLGDGPHGDSLDSFSPGDPFGGYGERISDPNEIVPAIRRGVEQTQAGKPALLEFLTAKETEISRP